MKSIIIASLVALAIASSPAFDRTFSPKSEYVYKFDGLLLSGLPTTSSDASQTRISCRTRIQAIDDRYIHLQLSEVTLSSSHVPQTEQWPKMESLEQRELTSEQKELLELPIRAQIKNGLIAEIQFSYEDTEWSKNTKRSILNLLSLHKSAPVNEEDDEPRKEDSLFYTVHEKTMEGDCEVAYTIVQEEEKTIYTKSVNFDKCITRPETAYGLRFGSECQQCEKEGQFVKPQTVYTYTFKNEKLEKSEVHSVYTLNVNGQEVIKSETRSKVVFVEERKINNEISKANGAKEEIAYSMANEELIEKFYQQGDKVEVNPFKIIPTEPKFEQLQEIFRQVQDQEENTPETVHLIARAVRLFRMCTVEELKKVHTQIYAKADKKVQLVIETTLAVAGTKNTVQHLIHHFEKKTISPLRASELLKSIQETLYPSEEIADLLIKLAQSPLAEKEEPLRQSAWLSAGSVVRGFASKTMDLPLARPATRQLKEKYVRVFMQLFRKAETTYEKVLAIKTLGNAGIDLSVYELVQLIQDPRQPLSIRTEAVEALRLLKDTMPRKIQKVLLPVYKNRQNKPELRMAALWRMMHTLPEESVLAQVVSQMEKESNQHVAAFTYNVIRQFARSTNPCYQPLAVRCSKVLLFTRYQPQEQILSTYAQLPFFHSESFSGVQFDFATIFEKNAFLPKELHASMESLFGGNWNKYFAQVGFSQQNFEQVIYKVLERLSLYGKQSDELRSRRVQSGIQMLQEIAKKMNIRPRVQRTDLQNAHAVFYLRYKEMDYVVLPIDMETIDNLVEKFVKNGEFDLKSVLSFFNNDSKFELHRALYFYESSRRIPTTLGMPLTISGKMPTILSVNGKITFELEKLGARFILDVVPSVATTHVTSMRFWSPLFEQGVKSLQSARIHTPLKLESTVQLKKNALEISHKFVVPQNRKTTVAVYSRPVAFIRIPKDQDEYVEAEEKTISHSEYQMTTEEIDREYEVLGLRITSQGNMLSQWTLPKVLMTEQDFEYTLENKNRPAEFVARFTVGNFEKTDLSEIKFDKMFEKEFDLENSNSEERREYFHKMVRQIQSEQGFRNLISIKLEAPQQLYWTTELRTVADQYVRLCKIEMDSRRSPMAHENKEWTLRSELLAVRPQMPSSLRQLREQPHREVQLALNAKWGSSKKNEMTINAQLEQSKEQKKYVRNMEREFNGIPEYELLIKAARLNQINIVSEYKFTPETEFTFSRVFELIKAYNFWAVSEKRIENEEHRVTLQLTVEPMSRQFLNMTIQTPQQQVELQNVRIPRVILPTIARRAMFQQAWQKTEAVCKIEQSEVSTFDNVIYRAPLTTCFSLVAKDCSEQPTFAVLSKKMNKNSDELVVKVVRRDDEIVVEKTDDDFLVKINGEKIEQDRLEKYEWIDILGDNLIVIRLPEGEVRFDGYTIKTHIQSVASKAQLCGLCGNNDGEIDNEFMSADNYDTEDVNDFHKSYLLKDEECKVETERVSPKKNFRNKWNREERDESEYESDYEEKTQNDLVKKTLIKEFSHRVCFSLEPVAECRRGYASEKTSQKKLRFTCMPRHSKNARRFLNEAREQNILDLADFPVSYVEAFHMPTTCVAY